eukprot:scaffold16501_cov72-Phaeocystis_antarctica.AAC.3
MPAARDWPVIGLHWPDGAARGRTVGDDGGAPAQLARRGEGLLRLQPRRTDLGVEGERHLLATLLPVLHHSAGRIRSGPAPPPWSRRSPPSRATLAFAARARQRVPGRPAAPRTAAPQPRLCCTSSHPRRRRGGEGRPHAARRRRTSALAQLASRSRAATAAWQLLRLHCCAPVRLDASNAIAPELATSWKRPRGCRGVKMSKLPEISAELHPPKYM